MSETATQDPQGTPRESAAGITLGRYAVLVAAGAFATTFAQQKVLALYPTTFLLKDHLQLKREEVSYFMFWAVFAWNLKPFAGILTDAFPLFGTRRKSYMILGAGLAGILWLVMARYPDDQTQLLIACIGMNIATVFASTVMGGLMVEAGQVFGASGRISSLRQFVQSVAGIGGLWLGGLLAAAMLAKHVFHPIWWTVTMAIAAVPVLLLAVMAVFVLREKPIPRVTALAAERARIRIPLAIYPGLILGAALTYWLYKLDPSHRLGFALGALVAMLVFIIILTIFPTRNATVVKAQGQLGHILESRTLWLAVFMLFLVYTVPGFNTTLTFRQEDVMHFGQGFIGMLGSVENVAGVVAALIYAVVCRKLNLRILLIVGVGVNALTTLLYLLYHPGTPNWFIIGIHATGGFWVVMSELALMDLAVRSTPKGCEALGFALMMSVRNFGISLSDLLGSKMIDAKLVEFNQMVVFNAATTLFILVFVPLLPRFIMSRREGESMKEPAASPG
jgi:MFS family permease